MAPAFSGLLYLQWLMSGQRKPIRKCRPNYITWSSKFRLEIKNKRIIFGHLFLGIPLASLSLKMPSSGNLFRWKKVSFAFVVYFLSQYWATVHLELSSSRKEFTLIFLPLKGKKNEWKKWAVQFSFPKYIFSHLALLSYYFCGYISTRPLWPEGKNYWGSWRQKLLHVFTSRLFQNQNFLRLYAILSANENARQMY